MPEPATSQSGANMLPNNRIERDSGKAAARPYRSASSGTFVALGVIVLALPNGVPSHDTFNRVFAALDPDAFQACFTAWINAVCGELGFCHIPVDGKAARGTRGPDGTCLHLVSAWVGAHRLSLAQVAVP